MPTRKKGNEKTASGSRAKKAVASVVVIKSTKPAEPQEFFEATDWEGWFHEFATERVSRGGGYRFASTFEFAKVKGVSRQQRDLILHIIGPVVVGKTPMFKNIPQYDWEKRRKDGFWLGPESLKSKIDGIIKESDTIDVLKLSAQTALLPLLLQVSAMFDKIEAAFGGQLFLPGASMKDNDNRASLYMRLCDQAINGTIKLQEAYARALLINVNDMPGMVILRENISTSKISDKSGELTGAKLILSNIIEMTSVKGRAHNLPLPDPEIAEVVGRQREA
jgi:hypothetical protein